MPGRVSRTARSAPSTRSKPSDAPDEGESTSLRESVVYIFSEVQRPNTGHRKLVVALRKLQEACAYEPSRNNTAFDGEFDETDFNSEVARCTLRVLTIKKSEPVGDRLVRFLGVFLKHATAQGERHAPSVSNPSH